MVRLTRVLAAAAVRHGVQPVENPVQRMVQPFPGGGRSVGEVEHGIGAGPVYFCLF